MPGWIAASVIALITFLGALLAGLLPRLLAPSKSLTKLLPAIAAGLLLASALAVVLPEGFELVLHSPDDPFKLPLELAGGLAVLAGFLFMLGLETGGMDHEQPRLHPLALGLGIHEFTDGLALGASLATGSLALTLPILAAVLAHRIPVAFGLGAFLWRRPQEVPHPLRTLIGFSLATPLGLLTTFLLLEGLAPAWIGLWLLFSGGTFLYVAAVDALGRVRREQAGMRLFFRVGFGVILLIAAWILVQALGLEAGLHS
ncbi:hypothetical protein JCM13664_17270 [Methylothermus subterraneus]